MCSRSDKVSERGGVDELRTLNTHNAFVFGECVVGLGDGLRGSSVSTLTAILFRRKLL
jgi:hypothetical protein